MIQENSWGKKMCFGFNGFRMLMSLGDLTIIYIYIYKQRVRMAELFRKV